jgi:hypothetical protein
VREQVEITLCPSIVIGSPCTCSVCYGKQCGRDIASTADTDADPHALESSLHWLRHCSRRSCLAAGQRHDANNTRRACGTPDRVSWYRDGDGICDANNAVACSAVPSLDWLCAILEAGQLYAIGRQASFQDFAFSFSGVLIGATLVWIARTCWVRARILKPTFVE